MFGSLSAQIVELVLSSFSKVWITLQGSMRYNRGAQDGLASLCDYLY